MYVNKVFFSGRLTLDPEVNYTADGTAVCSVSLAQNARVKEGDKWVDGDPIFVDVTFWGKRAESFAKHHEKGQEVYVEGKLRFDKWKGKDGDNRTRLRVNADEWQFVGRMKNDEATPF